MLRWSVSVFPPHWRRDNRLPLSVCLKHLFIFYWHRPVWHLLKHAFIILMRNWQQCVFCKCLILFISRKIYLNVWRGKRVWTCLTILISSKREFSAWDSLIFTPPPIRQLASGRHTALSAWDDHSLILCSINPNISPDVRRKAWISSCQQPVGSLGVPST